MFFLLVSKMKIGGGGHLSKKMRDSNLADFLPKIMAIPLDEI